MRILLCPNTHNPAALAAARSIAAALHEDGQDVVLTSADARACGLDGLGGAEKSDGDLALVVALGGDGTILKAVHGVAPAEVPIIGVKLGRLGFLSGTDDDDPVAAVRAALRGETVEERRSLLDVSVLPAAGATFARTAFNEVFLGRGAGARAVDVAVGVDGERLFDFLCDGIIVATPTGSTAYALSAGGPLVAPDVDAILVVPVGAHSLKARPVVLAASAHVELTLPDADRADASVVVDGEAVPAGGAGTRVGVTTSGTGVRLLRIRRSGFAAAVRDTFL